jgi:hypothetical protein
VGKNFGIGPQISRMSADVPIITRRVATFDLRSSASSVDKKRDSQTQRLPN